MRAPGEAASAASVPGSLGRSALVAAPIALVVAVALALWLGSGVGLHDIALFAGYQAGFVAIPGILVYRVLAPEDSLARRLVFGWVLGYALEIAAFLGSGVLGVRGLFPFYPLLAAPLLALVARSMLRSRAGALPRPVRSLGAIWAGAVVGAVTLAYIGLAYFARTPLPWDVTKKVTYDTDVPFALGAAGEALHHWPMKDPNVSGLGVHYHIWAHLDLAATSFVTGIPLPLVLFRLALFPLVLLFVAQLVIAGRVFTGRAAVGALTAALLLLVGEVDLEPWYSFPFIGYFFLDVWMSPTFLLGLVFFVPLITLVGERIKSGEPLRSGWRRWVLITILLVACSGAKPPTVAVLGGGLAATIAWQWWRSRRINPNAVAALGATTLVFAVFYAIVYRYSTFGLGVDPFGSFGAMGWVYNLRVAIGDGLGWPLGVLIGTLALFGPMLAGLIGLFALRRHDLDEGRIFLLALLLVGLVPFYVMHQSGNSQAYFSGYGLVGGTILAAEGIVLLASKWPRAAAGRSTAAVAVATATAVVLVVYGIVTRFSLPGPAAPHLHTQGARAVLVLAVIFVLVWRWSSPSGRRSPWLAAGFTGATGVLLLLWHVGWNTNLVDAGYELVAVLLVMIVAAAIAARGDRRRELLLMFAIAAVTIGALDVPLDQGPNAIDRLRRGVAFSNVGETGLSRGLYNGLSWIRKNTSTDAVLAVNNAIERNVGYREATYFYYAAFAERRVFLEGWLFTGQSWNILGRDAVNSRRVPFPRRERLNRAVFERADAGALQILVRDYGVRYLVDDKLQGTPTRMLGRIGRVAYSNAAVTIYAVGPARRSS